MSTIITKALLIGSKADATGRKIYTFKASTAATDRQGEIVTADGWKIDNFRANPVILDSHNYGTVRSILGKAVETRTPADGPEVDIVFAPTPEGLCAEQLVEGGFLNTVSVGFQSLKREPGATRGEPLRHTEKDLLEVSMVPVPANPEAVRLRTAASRSETQGSAKTADFDDTLSIQERMQGLWMQRYRLGDALDTANSGVIGDERLTAEGKIQAIEENLAQWVTAILAWYREAIAVQEAATAAGLEMHLSAPEGTENAALAGPPDGKAGRKLSKSTIVALRGMATAATGLGEGLSKMCDEVEGAGADDQGDEADPKDGTEAKAGGDGAVTGDETKPPENVEGLDVFADALKAFAEQA